MTTRVAEYASFKIALSSLSKLGNSLRPREKEKKEEKKEKNSIRNIRKIQFESPNAISYWESILEQ